MFDQEFILMDTEFTAWEGSYQTGWSRPGEHRELLRLTAMRVGKSFTVQGIFDQLCKPRINPKLSKYIIQLTGITQREVDALEKPTVDVIEDFFEFCSADSMLFCYGNDEKILQENLYLSDRELSSKRLQRFRNLKDYLQQTLSEELVAKTFSGMAYTLHEDSEAAVRSMGLTEHSHNPLWDIYSQLLLLRAMNGTPIIRTNDPRF